MFKKIVFIILLCLPTICFSINCKKNMVMTNDMDKCAYSLYQDSDKKLNAVYLKIMIKYKDYPEALHNTIQAERIWIKFRGAQLAMKYPPLKKGHYYGRIHPVFKYSYLEELTDQRTKQLKEILSDSYIDDLND